MKRLLLNLLAIVSVTLVFGGSAWAQTTILSFSLDETSTNTFSVEGGNIEIVGTIADNTTVNAYCVKLDNDKTKHVKVSLSNDEKLQEGDVIKVIMFAGSNQTNPPTFGVKISTTDFGTACATLYTTKKNTLEEISYTVQSGDGLEGESTFYINRNTGNSVQFQGLTITRPSSDFVLKTEDTDYYTLYLDYNATIPTGVTAYTGKLNADESKVNVTPVTGNVLPANTAVLVKTTTAGSYTFAKTDETADEITGNDLEGVAVETAVSDVEVTGKTLLTLGTLDGVVGFRRPSYTNLEANKAYILVNNQTSEKQSVIGIGTGGDTTGITGIQTDTQAGDTTTYNIAGQRVNDNAKGLLIRNGKKFIRK